MTDAEQIPEVPTYQPVPDSLRLPWEREQGWLMGFFTTCFMIVCYPKKAYALRPAGAFYKPWLFVFLAGLPGLCISTYFDPVLFEPEAAGASPDTLALIAETLFFSILSLGTLAIVGYINHRFLAPKVAEPAPLWGTYRALAYSSAVRLLAIPLDYFSGASMANDPASPETGMLGLPSMMLWIYGLYLQCVGLAAIHHCDVKTALISILKTALVLVPVIMVITLGIAKYTGAFD